MVVSVNGRRPVAGIEVSIISLIAHHTLSLSLSFIKEFGACEDLVTRVSFLDVQESSWKAVLKSI